MSSSTSPQQDRMLAQQRAHEPSMEEILASIRRIIADDAPAAEAPPAPARAEQTFRSASVREAAFRESAPRPAPVETPAPTPLAPDRPANAEAPSYSGRIARPEAFSALTARLGLTQPEARAPAPQPAPEAAPAPVETFDVSQAIVDVVSEDLAQRAAAPAELAEPAQMLSHEADAAVAAQFGKLSDALMANNAQRLDEMARQMLRPMLKSWLDDNLPVLVERLVRAEIERVARGGR